MGWRVKKTRKNKDGDDDSGGGGDDTWEEDVTVVTIGREYGAEE